jgi:hypothetical protein
MCLILFIIGATWMLRQQRLADIWRLGGSLTACSVIVFGLAGAALIPMYMATNEMVRHVGYEAVIGRAQIPWRSFNLYQLRLEQAPGILIKPTWIYIVGSHYVGPLGLIGIILTALSFSRA